jgi:hypothetical protein
MAEVGAGREVRSNQTDSKRILLGGGVMGIWIDEELAEPCEYQQETRSPRWLIAGLAVGIAVIAFLILYPAVTL